MIMKNFSVVRHSVFQVLVAFSLDVACTFDSASAQEGGIPSSIKLQDVLHSTLEHYPEVRSSYAELQSSEGIEQSTLGYFDPKLFAYWEKKDPSQYQQELYGFALEQRLPYIGAKIGFAYDDAWGKFGTYENDRVTGQDGRTKFYFDLPLLRDSWIDSGRTKIEVQRSKMRQLNQQYQLTLLDASRQAGQRYFEWVTAVNRLRAIEDLLNVAEERQKGIETRVLKGDLPRIDSIENMRQIFQRKTQKYQAELAVQTTSMNLSMFIRDKSGKPIRLKSEQAPQLEEALELLAPPNPSRDEELVQTHPLLVGLNESVEQKRAQVRLQENAILPKLNLKMHFKEELGELPPIRTQRDESFAGVQFEFGLLNREARGLKSAAEQDLIAAEAKRNFAQDKLRIDLQKLRLESQTSENIYKTTSQELEYSRQVEKAERTRFMQGDGNLFTVNLREQDRVQTQLKNLDSFLDWKRKLLDLAYIQGDINAFPK